MGVRVPRTDLILTKNNREKSPFSVEAASIKLCYEISLLSLPVSRRELLLSPGPILCEGLANSQKIQSSALFVTRVNVSNMAIFAFLAFTLAFTLATIKDFQGLDFFICAGWLGHWQGPCTELVKGITTSPFWRLVMTNG